MFVNRGWIHRSLTEWDRPVGVCKLLAIGQEFENKKLLSPLNDAKGNKLLWLEKQALIDKAGVKTLDEDDILLIEEITSNHEDKDSFPKKKEEVYSYNSFLTPETHMVYSFTWLLLSLASVAYAYLLKRKGK